jgi:uncharacterized protein
MEKRKTSILGTIEEQGKLTPELQKEIENCVSSSILEDLYLPFRPKRKTRATVAVAKGLEPLADLLWSGKSRHPEADAKKFVKGEVASVDEALSGARDIIAERLSETARVRENLRGIFRTRRVQSKATKAAQTDPNASKYRSYFSYSQPIAKIPSYNLLALLRAENEGFLNLSIDADAEKCGNKMYYDYCQEKGYPSHECGEEIRKAVDDAYKRLLEPSITNEVLKEAKEKADADSVRVFGENLRQLLLAAPVGQKRTMAIDPGFRTGCKVVILNPQGKLLYNETIYPHPPVGQYKLASDKLKRLVLQYQVDAIAIGNGTAGRETENFVRYIPFERDVKAFMVNESGASVYSASPVAREEFPDYDVTVRGAVSIGRRLMDPLAELVKIDPKSIGVGQYQHDVNQKMLQESLQTTVESCVNYVGVELNTASKQLLSYVSGVGPALAQNIVDYRNENGPFVSREGLKKVPRFGAKAFQQAAGFLRIREAENPLDGSAVHPESYKVVEKMAKDLHCSVSDLIKNKELRQQIVLSKYITDKVGLPTLEDIMKELAKPGRDPRSQFEMFEFDKNVHTIHDLTPGMVLPGIITNITNFGCFVDVGVHTKGLVHVSELADHFVKDPASEVQLHQHVQVKVISVDLQRDRLALSMKGLG